MRARHLSSLPPATPKPYTSVRPGTQSICCQPFASGWSKRSDVCDVGQASERRRSRSSAPARRGPCGPEPRGHSPEQASRPPEQPRGGRAGRTFDHAAALGRRCQRAERRGQRAQERGLGPAPAAGEACQAAGAPKATLPAGAPPAGALPARPPRAAQPAGAHAPAQTAGKQQTGWGGGSESQRRWNWTRPRSRVVGGPRQASPAAAVRRGWRPSSPDRHRWDP